MAPETATIDFNTAFLTTGSDSVPTFDSLFLASATSYDASEVLHAATKHVDDEDEDEDEDAEDEFDEDEDDEAFEDEDEDEDEDFDDEDDDEFDEDEDGEVDEDDEAVVARGEVVELSPEELAAGVEDEEQ